MSDAPRHRTLWEDAGYAGIECDGVDVGLTLDAETPEPPRVCPRCGTALRLQWSVHIEEVALS